MEIIDLTPSLVWKHFAALCGIPHPSGHEAGIREYIRRFAVDRGLDYREDPVGNVILIKPATPGRESVPSVILQAHMDMVPQKNAATEFDFLRDPIRPRIDGEWVKATCTTLGADNGIGLSAALAVMEDPDLRHGPLKAIFTVEEETGLSGALNLSRESLSGKILFNLDSEEEGLAFIGCAGGERADFLFNCDPEPVPVDNVSLRMALTGLRGGHSGMEINTGRGNAVIILAQVLREAMTTFPLRLASLNGGSLDNAIPREAFADLVIPPEEEMEFAAFVNWIKRQYAAKLGDSDPGMQLILTRKPDLVEVMDPATQKAIVNAVATCRNGVVKMCESIPELVETSSNLGLIETRNGIVKITCLLRSSNDLEREKLLTEMSAFFTAAGADMERRNAYPGWQPNPDSPALKHLQQVYHDLFQGTLHAKAVHAGLECGIFKGICPELDMISFGPEIRSPHSPDERVHIGSVARFYQLLGAALGRLG